MPDPLARARELIDQAHAADPERVDGRAGEALYAERLEAWIRRLVSAPSDALLLAARCQHLERWAIPRSSFPMDRPSYHRWRKAVHVRQGERARAILLAAGCDQDLAARVGDLVAKAAAEGDAESQALEDAACLVFIADELAGFAAEHAAYTRDKFVDIIRRTWAKMSPAAHDLALAIPLPPALRELVVAAVTTG